MRALNILARVLMGFTAITTAIGSITRIVTGQPGISWEGLTASTSGDAQALRIGYTIGSWVGVVLWTLLPIWLFRVLGAKSDRFEERFLGRLHLRFTGLLLCLIGVVASATGLVGAWFEFHKPGLQTPALLLAGYVLITSIACIAKGIEMLRHSWGGLPLAATRDRKRPMNEAPEQSEDRQEARASARPSSGGRKDRVRLDF